MKVVKSRSISAGRRGSRAARYLKTGFFMAMCVALGSIIAMSVFCDINGGKGGAQRSGGTQR